MDNFKITFLMLYQKLDQKENKTKSKHQIDNLFKSSTNKERSEKNASQNDLSINEMRNDINDSPEKAKKSYTFILFASLFSNMMKYYDFTIYSVFAALIGNVFFPEYSSSARLMLSYSVFAVGFIGRPFGGFLFGYIALRFSKRRALIFASLMMSLTTMAIGFLPSYERLGIYSSILLIVLRIVQGVCVSGEGANVAVYVLENVKSLKRGYAMGIVHASNIAGTVVGTIIGIIAFRIDNVNGWRHAFIFGGILSLVGLILRMRIPVKSEHENLSSLSLWYHIKLQWKKVVLVILTSGFAASIVYIGKSYMNTMFANKYDSLDIGMKYTFYTSLLTMLIMPLAGKMNDNFDPVKILKNTTLVSFILIVPMFILFQSDFFIIEYAAILTFAIISACIATTSYLFCASIFSSASRFSLVSVSYNVGAAVFGGTTPVISEYLTRSTNLVFAPGFYIAFNALCLLLYLAFYGKINLYCPEE